MLPTEPIVLLLDRLEHEGWGVHGLLDGWQLTVLLEVDAAVCAQQDVFSAPVVPVFGGGGEAVPAGVPLQLLLAVLTVKVILTSRTQIQEFTGRRSGGRVDRGGRCASLNSSEHSLPAVPAVGTGAGCLWCFLPVVIEGNQFPGFLIGKQLLSDSEEVLAVLSEPLNEAFLFTREEC